MDNKELKKEFRETEIGKNLYRRQTKWGIIFIICLVIYLVLFIVSDKFDGELITNIESVIDLFCFFVEVEFVFALGAYEGAFKYFKTTK